MDLSPLLRRCTWLATIALVPLALAGEVELSRQWKVRPPVAVELVPPDAGEWVSAEILADGSIAFEHRRSQWYEPALHFRWDSARTLDGFRLEILPVAGADDRRLTDDGEQRKLMLFDVPARIVGPRGAGELLEYSGCVHLQNSTDDTTVACIDYASDTGWQVPPLPAGVPAQELVFTFMQPLTLQPGDTLVLQLDEGGADHLAFLARVRISFPRVEER